MLYALRQQNRLINSLRRFRSSATNPIIRIVEVGPRDGLQNENKIVESDVKIEFINRLTTVGFQSIEVTSFVSAKWVPQFSDNYDVFKGIDKKEGVSYPVLVPNLKGFEQALAAGAKEIAIFTAASETFNQKNINCSIAESIERFKPVTEAAKKENIKIRGYVSTVAGCPYEGVVKPQTVAKVTETLLDLGCYEISLGDTIGVGTVDSISKMLTEVLNVANVNQLAVHFHNTYGQALPNILVAVNAGVSVVDSAVSGLGGCPYARGATGNVPTEDVVYMLHGLGANTGINLPELVMTGRFICNYLNKNSQSKVTLAMGDLQPLKSCHKSK